MHCVANQIESLLRCDVLNRQPTRGYIEMIAIGCVHKSNHSTFEPMKVAYFDTTRPGVLLQASSAGHILGDKQCLLVGVGSFTGCNRVFRPRLSGTHDH